jgi:predicted membrane chloride channel (bestrophin family)
MKTIEKCIVLCIVCAMLCMLCAGIITKNSVSFTMLCVGMISFAIAIMLGIAYDNTVHSKRIA